MYYKTCPICNRYKGNPICKWCKLRLERYNNKLTRTTNNSSFNYENFYKYIFDECKKEKKANKQHFLCTLLLCVAKLTRQENLIDDAYKKINYINNYPKKLIEIDTELNEDKFIDNFINEYISKTKPNKMLIKNNNDNNDFRKQFPTNILCQDGHYVRSKEERAIDDYLYQTARLLHAYEPKFRLTPEEQALCKKAGKDFECFYPDFYIPEYNLYIEFFGKNEEQYNLKTDLKIKIYKKRENINFAYLTYNDSNILLEKLEDILDNFKNGKFNNVEDDDYDVPF